MTSEQDMQGMRLRGKDEKDFVVGKSEGGVCVGEQGSRV